MSFTGKCACGGVTATITADAPTAVVQCWCRQCQQVCGGGPAHNAFFANVDMVLSGSLASHAYPTATGQTISQFFCPRCGTPVLSRHSGVPDSAAVRLGFLDPGHGLAPGVAMWLAEAPDWAAVPEGLPRFETQPGPPQS